MADSEIWENTTDWTLPNEIWKPVKGYEEIYEVSNFGRCRTLEHRISYKNRIVHRNITTLNDNRHGYLRARLSLDGTTRIRYIHRLVAETFIPNPNNYPCINHKDENPHNNCVDNLEWCTAKYNCNYGNHNRRMKESRKTIPIIAVNVETGKETLYQSYAECVFAISGKVNSGVISAFMRGRQKSAYGHIFKNARYKELYAISSMIRKGLLSMEDKTSTRLIDIYTPKQIKESEVILARVKAIIEHNLAIDKTDYSSLPEIDVNTYSTEQILRVIMRGSN